MSLRYLNLLFAVAITIAGWGTIKVALSVDRPTNYQKDCPFWVGVFYKSACKAIDALFKTKKRVAADIGVTGIVLLLLGILYGLVFLFWEAGLFIRKKKLRKNELQ